MYPGSKFNGSRLTDEKCNPAACKTKIVCDPQDRVTFANKLADLVAISAEKTVFYTDIGK